MQAQRFHQLLVRPHKIHKHERQAFLPQCDRQATAIVAEFAKTKRHGLGASRLELIV